MKRYRLLIWIFPLALISGCSTGNPAPAVFDTDGAVAMLEVLQAIHDGADDSTVESLFDQVMLLKSYRICVQHFTDPRRPESNRVSESQYKTFIMSLLHGEADTQGNRRLGYMKPLYEEAVKNPRRFAEAIDRFREIPVSRIQDSFDLARKWLPDDIELKGRVQLVFDMGGGAWIFTDQKGLHHVCFNILFMLDENDKIDQTLFLGTLAHEMHHIGLPDESYYKMIHYDTLDKTSRLKLFTDFIAPLIGEGLAQKFCSNAPGVLTGKPYQDHSFAAISQAKKDWKFYMSQLAQIHQRFVRDLTWILEGDITDQEQFDSDYTNYWTWHARKVEGKKFVLGRRYYYGSELVGIINKGLGKEALFEVMYDYRKLIPLYNQALLKVKPKDHEKYRIPESLISKIEEL